MKKLMVMKVNVTLLAAMALTVSAAPWYESPTVRATASIGAANGDTHPHFMNKAADDSVLAINLNADGDKVGTVFFRIADLLGANGEVSGLEMTPIQKPSDGYGNSFSGIAVSSDLNLLLVGSTDRQQLCSMKTDVSEWSKISGLSSVTLPSGITMNGLDFGTRSTYLYSVLYTSGSRNKIVRWSYSSLDGSGDHMLEESGSITLSNLTRVRNISVYRVDGRELLYCAEGDGGASVCKVFVIDVTASDSSSWNVTELNVSGLTDFSGDIMNVKLSNENTVAPVLYVMSETGRLAVCELSSDGKSINSVKKIFSAGEMIAFSGVATPPENKYTFRNFEVTQDGTAAFLLHRNGPATTVRVLRTVDSQAVSGVVRIGAGEIKVVGEPINYAYYRFSVKDIYNCDGSFELSELALYDKDGNRVNMNLTSPKNSASISDLQPGTMTAIENGGWGKGVSDGEGAPKMFDGNTGTKCYMGGMSVSGGKLPQIVMRLKADAEPVTAYAFCTGDDCSRRTPISWTLEGSVNGVTWCMLDKQTDARSSGLVVISGKTWTNAGRPIATAESAFANPRAQYCIARGGALEVAVETSWDSILNFGGDVKVAAGVSAVWNVDDPGSVLLPGGGFVGSGEIMKRGTGTMEVGGFNDDFKGQVKVESGALTFTPVHAPVASRVYRFSIKQFAGSGYYEITEVGLYDKNGNRLNLNLSAGSSDPTKIGSGQMNVSPSGSNWEAAFDGNLSTKLEGNQSGPTVDGDSSKWIRILMRLPQGSAPVAGYNIASGNDVAGNRGRNPIAWRLESTENGTDWTILDDRNFETNRITWVNSTWFNGGKVFPVHVTSNRAPSFTSSRKYFRFNIRAKSGTVNGDFELSELALYDKDGNRVNMNLANKGNSAGVGALTPGSFTWQENGSWARGAGESEAPQKVFDGNVDTKAFMGNVNKSAAPWPCFIMRLADDAAPVASYGIALGNDTSSTGRTPKSWSLEDSDDGVDWRVIAEESDAITTGLARNSNKLWANNGFPIGISTGDRCLAPTEASFSVAEGAKLVLPVDQGEGFSRLSVDCASAGTIENFKAAPGMKLDLTGFKAFKRGVHQGKALPITFTGNVDLTSVGTWNVSMDGMPNESYECFVSEGRIFLSGGPGLVLIFR